MAVLMGSNVLGRQFSNKPFLDTVLNSAQVCVNPMGELRARL